jgi:hypothetical protein
MNTNIYFMWNYFSVLMFCLNSRRWLGARSSVVVKALCYKSEGRGIAIFSNLPNPSGRYMALGST